MALLQLWLEMKHMDLTFFISSLGWKLKAICTGASIQYHLFMKKNIFLLYTLYVSDIIFSWKKKHLFTLYFICIQYNLSIKNIFIFHTLRVSNIDISSFHEKHLYTPGWCWYSKKVEIGWNSRSNAFRMSQPE